MTKIVEDALKLYSKKNYRKLELILSVMTKKALNEYEDKKRRLDSEMKLQNNSIVGNALSEFLSE